MAKSKNGYWVAYADLMTLLMVIFLLISVSYMALIEYGQKQRNRIFQEYGDVRNTIYQEFLQEFQDSKAEWQVEIMPDLSVKFQNSEVLFGVGESELTPRFKQILDDFMPRYFDILLDSQYIGKITEIRIEGHTDLSPIGIGDSYVNNMELSQARARMVLAYFRQSVYYKNLPQNKQSLLTYLVTANGMSFGRTLDKDKRLTAESGLTADYENSRRVEFRVITNSEALIEQVIKSIR